MATTYSNFLTQVRNYTEVDSNVLTDAIIQDFIRSVELDVAGKVDYDDLRKYATSPFADFYSQAQTGTVLPMGVLNRS